MVYYVSTMTVRESLGGDTWKKSIEWAKKFTKYLQGKWPEWEIELLTNYTGPTNEVHWISKYESPGAREELLKEYNQDEGVKALFDEWSKMQTESGDVPFMTNPRQQYYRIVDLD